MKETIEGEVQGKNGWGIKIGDNWFNYPPKRNLERAEIGDIVILEVNGGQKKWINSIKFTRKVAKPKDEPKKEEIPHKDIRISRLSLLSTATQMLATHGKPITTEEIVGAAQELEKYVYEPREEKTEKDPDVPF